MFSRKRVYQCVLVVFLTVIIAMIGSLTVLAAPSVLDIQVDAKKGIITKVGETDNIITKSYNLPRSRWELQNGYWTFYYADGTQPVGDVQYAEDGTLLYYYAWEMIDGEWYAFDWNSTMVTGLVKDAYYNHVYYLDDETGAMVKGRKVIMSECYMFDEVSGHLLCDCPE